tara:strand:- start:3118 stop:3435 length:318 start_codon:yes stop_codon:yes gene_type:complete
MELEWYHKKLQRRIGKGSLPKFAEAYNDVENIKKLTQSHTSKIYKDIQKHDLLNKQQHLSSGGRKRRRTKRRGTKRRGTKRRGTKRRGKSRRKSKKHRRTRHRKR